MAEPDGPQRPTFTVLRGELESAPEAAAPAAHGQGQELSEKARDHVEKQTGKRPAKRQGPPDGERRSGEIYAGCPVQALGVEGSRSWYLDWLGQVRDLVKHDRDTIRHVFGGRTDVLKERFPRLSKDGNSVIGWDQESAAGAMQRAAAEQGVWNPLERLRGVGAWIDADGGVVMHCGDAILFRGDWLQPGEHEGFVYPSGPRIPRPLKIDGPGPEAAAAKAAEELEALLATWSWSRGELDAQLLLGWLGCAMFGGALRWRPLAWITGGPGSGKSTLQEVVRHVVGGEGALLQSSDASPASIWQMLGASTLPVALDEIEPDVDNRTRVAGVIKLARQAASGGVILRGGADHKGSEFKARSCFLFSSILRAAMLDQDISRMALLELDPLPKDVTPPAIRPGRLQEIGRALRGRVVAEWGRWHQTLELYRNALAAQGHGARGADQFGTLLAMADMLTETGAPAIGRCEGWAEKLGATTIADQVDAAEDWQRCASHLLGQQLDAWRAGTRHSVASLVWSAADLPRHRDDVAPDQREAQAFLGRVGMKIEGRGKDALLLVANRHPQLARLFQDTHWHAGAGQTGVWMQSFKRAPGSTSPGMRRFDGFPAKCIAIPVKRLLELDDLTPDPMPGETSAPETSTFPDR
ncbi:hypothetical protein P2H44_22755 [Albimonas sp. CAU 1670]|uniref:hypothetical protein n=1 Tax=Albimonas sp. CAU 1670 TaxID=3032599 RepID=UPI0023DA4610|nr:hypothetical protein [Albimonas sp. CAU 1670]MDF2235386.1 hypothetical protein [Albimonas sp. CAU 1670]